jgi:hypothetical protein
MMLKSTYHREYILKTKNIALFLLSAIYLTACGGVTPVPPAETSTPVSTSTKMETPRPTSAYELTQTAFESLMKNICPTTTPYPTQNGELNNISDNKILREFAGNYSKGNGFDGHVLNLNCDGSYHEVFYTDTGSEFFTQGNLEIHNGELLFKPSNKNDINTTIYLPVRWGQRKYLLAKEYDIETFCKATTTQDGYYQEPRNEESFIGLIYLRISDIKLDVTGSPALPNGKKICN